MIKLYNEQPTDIQMQQSRNYTNSCSNTHVKIHPSLKENWRTYYNKGILRQPLSSSPSLRYGCNRLYEGNSGVDISPSAISIVYCNNCGKNGHNMYQCKNPITSYGVIPFRIIKNPITSKNERQYLMICRKDTLSYVDFLRGKYSLFNRKYIKSLIKTMTENEKLKISTQSFDVLWYELWKNNENNTVLPPTAPLDYASAVPSRPIFPPPPPPPLPPFPVIPILPIQTDKKELYSVALAMKKMNVNVSSDYSQYNNKYNSEKYTSKDKYNILQSGYCLNGTPHFTINEIVGELEKERLCNIENNTEIWHVPEWGFCKGRRNYRESDYDCAIREMEEETGYSGTKMKLVKNINTFEEIFIGSNYKCYKHKYYLMYMSFEDSMKPGEYEKSEVSCTKWVSFDECLTLIRSYNIEKKRMITKIDEALNKYNLFMGQG